MQSIQTNGYSIEIGNLIDSTFPELLRNNYRECNKIILVDENTRDHCLNYLLTNFEELSNAEVILLPAGEQIKEISIVYSVWEALTEYGVTRHDLIINLGGGVISDIGGFMASCYKRGIDFINIPTSLLAMVDASIGGKTGINLGPYKNQIGLFSNPKALYIDGSFLETLPEEELLNGFAEMLKHGILSGRELFDEVKKALESGAIVESDLLVQCIQVKNEIVNNDPYENGERKLLNFGHTIGHVIEGHFNRENSISHGHAVAIGMLMEAHLSLKQAGLEQNVYDELENFILQYYPLPKFSDTDIQDMVEMLQNDKKNKGGNILSCLIKNIGECTFDNKITPEEFLETFLHFKNKQVSLN